MRTSILKHFTHTQIIDIKAFHTRSNHHKYYKILFSVLALLCVHAGSTWKGKVSGDNGIPTAVTFLLFFPDFGRPGAAMEERGGGAQPAERVFVSPLLPRLSPAGCRFFTV